MASARVRLKHKMIHVSPEAASQVKKILSEQNKPVETSLRVSVEGGGCSGLSYKLDFTEEKKTDDKVFEEQGIRVVVDPKSYLYLKGMTLEFSGGLNGTGFGFKNPNATKSCGCGSSFAVS